MASLTGPCSQPLAGPQRECAPSARQPVAVCSLCSGSGRGLTQRSAWAQPLALGRSRPLGASRRRPLRVQAVKDITEADFGAEVLEADRPVMVDFWAGWCGPCKLISPIMDQIEQEYGEAVKVVKVEADPNPKLVEQYKVYGLPAILLFKEGKVVPGGQLEGVIGKAKLLAWLGKLGVEPAVPA